MSSKYHKSVKKILRQIFPFYSIKEEVSMYVKGKTKNKEAKKLHVDLFVKDIELAIEVDGQHHYEEIDYGDGNGQVNFERRRYLDNMKDSIAYENGWLMVRVPYTEAMNREWIERAISEAFEEEGVSVED